MICKLARFFSRARPSVRPSDRSTASVVYFSSPKSTAAMRQINGDCIYAPGSQQASRKLSVCHKKKEINSCSFLEASSLVLFLAKILLLHTLTSNYYLSTQQNNIKQENT
jgi:hypothetical protein